MKKILLLILILTSISCFSAQELQPQEIDWIGTGWSAEGVYIRTKESIVSEGCINAVYRFNPDHPLKGEMMSILLSAFHTKKKVRFYVDGCVTGSMNLKAVKIVQ